MAVTAKFAADFSDFYTAVQKAEVSLKGFEQGAGRVESSLNKMTTSLSGRQLIQEATLMTEAVERIGGVSKLTESELQRVGTRAAEAATKMRALGIDVPPGMDRLAASIRPLEPSLTLADKAAGLLKSSFAQFTLAGLATTAISKLTTGLIEFADLGKRLPAIEQSFQRLTSSIQQDGQSMLASMTVATNGMVSNFDLMQSANKAMLLGLPVTSKSMGELAKTATVLGKAMGQDATKSLDDLITALGRSSPMILDNLGLTVKVGEANEKYAASLNKSADQLTDSEEKMAFYVAAMEAARNKTRELGEQTQTLGEIAESVWTRFGNVVTSATSMMNIGVGKALSSAKEFATFLEDVATKGAAVAISLAAARAEIDRLAQASGAAAPKLVDPIVQYRKHLIAARESADTLTAGQKLMIQAGLEVKDSVADIAKGIGLSVNAVQQYIDKQKEAVETAKDVKKIEKAWHDFFFEMKMFGTKAVQELTKVVQESMAKQRDSVRDAQMELLSLINTQRTQIASLNGTALTGIDATMDALNKKHAADLAHIEELGRRATESGVGSAAWAAQAQEATDNANRIFVSGFDKITEEINKTFVGDLPAAIGTPAIPSAASRAAGFIRQEFTGAFQSIATTAESTMARVAQLLADAEKNMRRGDAFGVGFFQRQQATRLANGLPGFADGVTNFSGGLAVVGERGPEVVSLPRGSSVTPNGAAGITVNIGTIVASGAQAGRDAADALKAQLMRKGVRI